jgi:hypothetical protein
LTVWIALYFLVTYAPFFVLGPYIAKHSLGGPGAWAIVVTGEGIGALGGAMLGLRIQPRHPWRIVAPVFALTAVQSVLLAAHAPVAAIGAAAVLVGFSFSYGSVVYETGIQQAVPREKLGRVSAYSWMAAMTFLPLGYAIAGWVGAGIGISTYLVVGAIWIVVTTVIVVSVRDVRDFRLGPSLQERDLAASVPAS